MAIISCPSCNKQISDKVTECQHCHYDFSNITAEQREQQQRRNSYQRRQSLQTQTFFALILFVGGFALWYWNGEQAEGWRSYAGQAAIAVGFIWYLVNRARLLLHKRNR